MPIFQCSHVAIGKYDFTKKHLQAMKIILKYTWQIICCVLVILLLLLFLSKCSTSNQANQDTVSAVAQNRIENLESNISILESENYVFRMAQDSLLQRNNELSKEIFQKEAKIAQIASNYAELKNKVKELPNDSAVGLFLDRADCSEFPVLKYDADYIMPIEPIRFYNLMAVDFDEVKETAFVLMQQYKSRSEQVELLNKVIDSKGRETTNLNLIINDKDGIIIQKDKQIVSGKKQLKAQKFKTVLVGIGGVLGIITAVAVSL